MEQVDNIIQQAVFLVGGKGSRLAEVAPDIPKPLVEVGGRPFLDYLLMEVARMGMKKALLLAGHLGEQVVEMYRDREIGGMAVSCIVEKKPMGTAGALIEALGHLDDEFLLFNGDTYFDFNYLDLATFEVTGDWAAKVALRKMENSGRYGTIKQQGTKIVRFSEKESGDTALINSGVYVIRKSLFGDIPNDFRSLETELFPALAESGRLHGKCYDGFFVDIGVPESLDWARGEMAEKTRRPAAFLDRDGVINVDTGYLHKKEDFTWIDKAGEAIKKLNDHGYFVFAITNQSGIARGYYQEAEVRTLHEWMNRRLYQKGAHIDQFYHCPHHPDGIVPELTRTCNCRKPAPGMLLRAFADWPVIKERSFLVGDQASDIEAARNAGIPGHLFDGQDNLDFFMTRLINDRDIH